MKKVYEIKQEDCIGCGICLDTCRYGAIETRKTFGYAHFEINQDKCIGCGSCAVECRGECIRRIK